MFLVDVKRMLAELDPEDLRAAADYAVALADEREGEAAGEFDNPES